MIGAAKILIANSAAPVTPEPLSGYITPPTLTKFTTNGAYTSPTIEAFPTGGTGPYTYEWSKVSGALSLTSTTDKTTKINCSGYNVEVTGIINCVITDATLATKTLTLYVSITFGSSGGFLQ